MTRGVSQPQYYSPIQGNNEVLLRTDRKAHPSGEGGVTQKRVATSHCQTTGPLCQWSSGD